MKKKMKIGVLGPEGTNTETAALRLGYTEDQLRYYITIEEEANDVINGTIDCGVMPLENSIEGSVGATLDLLLHLDVQIVREIVIPIHHSLAALQGADIEVIYSHWQAIAQCSKFSRTFGKEVIAVSSTSNAARIASQDRRAAAITSYNAAHRYGLQILREDIQDFKDNFTRFIVIAQEGSMRNKMEKYKTSVVIKLTSNKPGALYEALYGFARRKINLTKIESRPTKKALGDYLFYIDMEGHFQDETIRETLDELRPQVQMLKVLGSYSCETHLTY
jgi:prephenate dehydratase